MGNQWGDIYLCVSPTKMLGDVSPVPPIIAAPAWFLWFRPVSNQNGILVGLLASHGSSSDRPTDRQTHAHTHHRVAVPRLMIKILAQVKSSIARTKWYEITVKYKAPFVSSNSPFTLFYFTYRRFKWPKEFCKWSYRRRNSSGVQY